MFVGIDTTDLALVALLDKPPEQPRAVHAERGAEVGVNAEVVFEAGAERQAVGSDEVGVHLRLADKTIPAENTTEWREIIKAPTTCRLSSWEVVFIEFVLLRHSVILIWQ